MPMPKKTNRPLYLKIPAEEAFIRLSPGFVGQAALGLGLDEEAADELSLAAEEVIAYLARIGAPGGEVEIRCFAGSHYIQADFSFPLESLRLRAFNMTATVSFEDEAGLEEMGLLIASRMTDRFRISRRANGNPELSLIKERVYPEITDIAPENTKALTRFSLREPDPAEIKWFLRQVVHAYLPALYPPEFRYPGKIVDMTAAGDYRLLLAVGPAGEIGGGIAWKWEGLKTVELFGPYIFHPESSPQMAGELMDACIGSVARTSALVLIHRMPTPELPEGYLEALGAIGIHGADGACHTVTAYFREMHEDMGCAVWSHPDLNPFLETEYRRLVFPREVRPVSSDGEAGDTQSVLSAEMDRRLGRATLRPIWPGADRLENLSAHLTLLRNEGLTSVFFEMDIGCAWQTEFTPALFTLGFMPRMILPHAGAGDLVIFELKADSP
jgi:anti-sigma regulatory factor (Ser/Thr protein kinase)